MYGVNQKKIARNIQARGLKDLFLALDNDTCDNYVFRFFQQNNMKITIFLKRQKGNPTEKAWTPLVRFQRRLGEGADSQPYFFILILFFIHFIYFLCYFRVGQLPFFQLPRIYSAEDYRYVVPSDKSAEVVTPTLTSIRCSRTQITQKEFENINIHIYQDRRKK